MILFVRVARLMAYRGRKCEFSDTVEPVSGLFNICFLLGLLLHRLLLCLVFSQIRAGRVIRIMIVDEVIGRSGLRVATNLSVLLALSLKELPLKLNLLDCGSSR